MTDDEDDWMADPKFRLLRDLKLPASDYVIFGSAPIYIHSLRRAIDDLDIVARRLAWKIVTSLGRPTSAPSGNGTMIELYDGRLQFFDRWISPDWDVDKLIDQADMINGFPFAQLEQVYRSKLQSNRLGDQEDLQALRLYYSSH